MATVKLKDIDQPPHYLREKIKNSYVNELLEDLAAINGVKDWHELQPKKAEKVEGKKVKVIQPKINWPFPPIEVARNEKQVLPPAKKGQTKTETKKQIKAAKKTYKAFELIDGGHRMTVARRIGLKEIPATIKQITDPAERFLEQYKSNGGPRGLRLDKDDRDNAIRILAKEFNFSQKRLAAETGLDQTSISRILSSKMRKEGPRKPYERKENEPEETSPRSDGQSEDGLLERLTLCASDFPRLKSKFIALINQTVNEKGLALLIERVADIYTVLTATYASKFPKPKKELTA